MRSDTLEWIGDDAKENRMRLRGYGYFSLIHENEIITEMLVQREGVATKKISMMDRFHVDTKCKVMNTLLDAILDT